MLIIIITFCVIVGSIPIAFLFSILKSSQRADKFEEEITNIIMLSNMNINEKIEELEEIKEEKKGAKVFA